MIFLEDTLLEENASPDGEEDNRRKKKIGNEVEISGHTFTAWVRWSKSMVNINMCTIPTSTYITRCKKRKREKREREKIKGG